MRMEIPFGFKPGDQAGDSLPLVASATLVVVFTDGTHQSFIVQGPATGQLTVDRPEHYQWGEGPEPVAIAHAGTDVTFTFRYVKAVKDGHA